jgi:hypothetical protein
VFEPFAKRFGLKDRIRQNPSANRGDALLLRTFGGLSLEGGAYRIHEEAAAAHWTEIVTSFFSSMDVSCFGYDWLGRQFAYHSNGDEVLHFDIETGEYDRTFRNLVDFHNVELIEDFEKATALAAFREWLAHEPSPLQMTECVGYRIPFALGGEDDPSNFERSDMEVYWDICGQIRAQLLDVEEGSPVLGVKLT